MDVDFLKVLKAFLNQKREYEPVTINKLEEDLLKSLNLSCKEISSIYKYDFEFMEDLLNRCRCKYAMSVELINLLNNDHRPSIKIAIISFISDFSFKNDFNPFEILSDELLLKLSENNDDLIRIINIINNKKYKIDYSSIIDIVCILSATFVLVNIFNRIF
ncbi:hypothetical protein [Brazilian porcupinepox virus 1]|nr:hypothetical protein [Brazilian porcupinepox virus 1]